jgi:hypothetical protein
MIYDDLELQLIRECKRLGIDMSNARPTSFSRLCKIYNTKELASLLKVSERTIYNRKKRSGLDTPRIDYDRMDVLIAQGKSTQFIMAEMGCVKSTVNDRKRKLGYGKTKTAAPEIHYPVFVPMPLAQRKENLRKAMGMSRKRFYEWWLPDTPAGKDFMEDQRGING